MLNAANLADRWQQGCLLQHTTVVQHMHSAAIVKTAMEL